MNEEEQESLEILKGLEFEEYDWYVKTDKFEGHANEVVEKVEKAMKTILNLIEKQQKEIEKLKSKKYVFNAKTQEVKEIPIDDNYISKDKIEEKIKELESHIWRDGYMTKFDRYAIHYLKELLQDGQESDQEGGQEDE